MTEKLRPALALFALFGSAAFIYLWLGMVGAAGFAFGISATWLTVGIASGYWVGVDETTELMVQELMRRMREHRTQG